MAANLYPGAALVATGLAAHGYRKGSLSASGAVAAWAAGYAHLANPLKLFGVTMVVFYLAGSRATKVKASVKAKLEDGPDPSRPGGNRDWIQVLSNSLPGVVVALAYRANYEDSPPASLLGAPLARSLIFALVGHYAACLADTLASELGILARARPVHVLTGERVPAGTNGAVSPLGLGASVAGGAVIGLAVALGVCIESPAAAAARGFASATASPGLVASAYTAISSTVRWALDAGLKGPLPLVAWGTAAGLAGSLLDSLLGATLQRTLYSTADGRVLTDHSAAARASAPGVVQIGPGIDVLSNSAVNAVCGAVMAVIGYWVGGW